MDDKNLASQLIDKMKKYIREGSEEPETESTNAPASPEAMQNEPQKPTSLPNDEALFEFESFELEDDGSEEALAKETAAEVSEPGAAPDEFDTAEEHFEESARQYDEEAEVAAEEAPSVQSVSELSDISSDSVSVFFGIPSVSDIPAPDGESEIVSEPSVSETEAEIGLPEETVTDEAEESGTDVVFEDAEGVIEENTEEKESAEESEEGPRFFNPVGVQEKFDIEDLDMIDDKTEKEPEMTVVSGLELETSDRAEEEDDTDDDGDIDEFFDTYGVGDTDIATDEDIDDISDPEISDAELTEVDDEPDEAMEYNNDIWDDEERPAWTEEDRFNEFCASLPLPKMKSDDEERAEKASSGNPTVKNSGYRYEMTERLPLFPDGLRGGKEREGYVEREKAYCAEREENRRALLNGKLKRSSISIVFAAICLGIMLVYENIGAFLGMSPAKNIYLFSGIDILLVLVSAFIARNAVIDGVRCAVKGIFIPETVTFGVVVSSLLYNVLIMLCRPIPENVMLLGIPSGVAVLLTLLYRHYLLKREIKVFDIASSYGSYSTEVRMYGFRNTPEGAAFEGYVSPDSSLYRINRISRVDGAYNEQPQRDECYGVIRILALCIMCAAVVCGIVFGLIGREFYSGLLAAYSVIAFASPVSVFTALLVPRYVAASEAARDGGAIIGFDEESDEFDDNVIMLDDSELYPPEGLKIVKFDVCRSPMLEKHLARAAAMFKKTGGTLSGLFRNMEQSLSGNENVVVTEVGEHGISATVDGSTVRAGSAAYMQKYGIEVEKYVGMLSADTRVLYMSDNGEFFTRIVLSYSPNEALCRKIAGLRHADTIVSLKTCDPCIDKALVFCTTGLEPELLRVIKFEAGDDLAPAETDREGTLVSNNGATGLISALLEYKRQKKLVFGGSRFAAAACIAGMALALLFTVFGVRTGVMSAVMLAFHAALSGIGVFIGTRGAVNTKNKIKKK